MELGYGTNGNSLRMTFKGVFAQRFWAFGIASLGWLEKWEKFGEMVHIANENGD